MYKVVVVVGKNVVSVTEHSTRKAAVKDALTKRKEYTNGVLTKHRESNSWIVSAHK